MPAAGSGPAPVPYAGPDLQPEPPDYGVNLGPLSDAAAAVMAGVTNLGTTQDPSAHDVNGGTSGLVTPYYPGQIDPIDAAGADDPGGRSDVAATVAQAVANATDRWQNLQADTYSPGPVIGTAVAGKPDQQQGSVIGDLMTFPPSPLDPGVSVGNTLPTAGFYDPDREYGGTQGAPGYQGEAQ